MGRLTIALLRRRAEHNESCLSTLKEVALHQQEIERIENIGDVCRELEIIYLCNNYIPRIEGLVHLKFLSYLNLAVNNIKVIEGLEGCEMLTKLDLTVNFIDDLSSVETLQANPFLETLHLTGNPCTNLSGYRPFVIQTLPQLRELDGEEIVRSELITARQDADETADEADRARIKAQEEERIKKEMIAQGVELFPAKFNEKGERVYGHSAEERVQMLREQEEREREHAEKAKPAEGSLSSLAEEMSGKKKTLTPEEEMEKYGRVLMRNEAKLEYTMEEGTKEVVLKVQPGKFISTTLINVDAQTTYVRITVKGKVLQVVTPVEIAPDKASVQRSATTGELKLTLPLAKHILDEREQRRRRLMGEDDE